MSHHGENAFDKWVSDSGYSMLEVDAKNNRWICRILPFISFIWREFDHCFSDIVLLTAEEWPKRCIIKYLHLHAF